MKSRLIAGIAAVVLALVGAVMVFSFANGAEARAVQGLEPIDVLVVREPVPAGTPVSELAASLVVEQLPGSSVADTALKNLDSSAGMVTSVDLIAGEQLLAERLVDPSELVAPSSVEVPEGLHEISILVEPRRIAGGKVTAGDYVGVFMSLPEGGLEERPEAESSQLGLPKVLVTAVQGAPVSPAAADPAAEGEETQGDVLPEGSLMVTLALNPDQATRLVFVSEFGFVWLSKANAANSDAPPFIVQDKELYR
ncbi:Flp pilus assembly protein CpaB [uncultured Arthrobacter sp.]|uniref:Flp pilus assembly protein CpaB n=1 Tax=uncultured Arthrobacter sp. TaxID=114050 RepID=UPI0026241B8A|nr:Flp pilus assembly protein CpaB [uncultured Arthrobacter sp.]